MDIHQSPPYTFFLKQIGWDIKKIGSWNVFIRKIPFWGKIAKLQKIKKPIPFSEIKDFVRQEKIRNIIIEPDELEDNLLTAEFLIHGYKINHSPFLPTKTILIDLTCSEEKIFKSFSEAKRRAVRKAIKNKIKIEESIDIESFILLKRKYFPFFGFLLDNQIRCLWKSFYPNNAVLLSAYGFDDLNHQNKMIASVLLLFWKNKAYYWQAATSKDGNKFAAPSLLVWEALKLSKKKGCTIFDFEGIYDRRFHNLTKNWQGFTRFKEGFGGRTITYLGSFIFN